MSHCEPRGHPQAIKRLGLWSGVTINKYIWNTADDKIVECRENCSSAPPPHWHWYFTDISVPVAVVVLSIRLRSSCPNAVRNKDYRTSYPHERTAWQAWQSSFSFYLAFTSVHWRSHRASAWYLLVRNWVSERLISRALHRRGYTRKKMNIHLHTSESACPSCW